MKVTPRLSLFSSMFGFALAACSGSSGANDDSEGPDSGGTDGSGGDRLGLGGEHSTASGGTDGSGGDRAASGGEHSVASGGTGGEDSSVLGGAGGLDGECEADEYLEESGSGSICSPLTPCTSGQEQTADNTATSDYQCADCEAGTFCDGSSTKAICVAGEYCPDGATYEDCGAGFYCDGADTKTECVTVDSFSADASGATECVPWTACDEEEIEYDEPSGQSDRFCGPPLPVRASEATANLGGNQASLGAGVSNGGRFVVFYSDASNLVTGDTNGVDDVFLYDLEADARLRISVGPAGLQGNGPSIGATISADGSHVAFSSAASNLVVGDTNNTSDVFVYSRAEDTLQRISVNDDGVQGTSHSVGPSLSADGRFVAFASASNNFTPEATNGYQVYVHDRDTGTIELVSRNAEGAFGNGSSSAPHISTDGRYVAFASGATNLTEAWDANGTLADIFVYDRTLGEMTLVSRSAAGGQNESESYAPSISADGQRIVFHSQGVNLGGVSFRNNVFLHDRGTDIISLVSSNSSGAMGNNGSFSGDISDDGRWVSFHSSASNLTDDDENAQTEIFVKDLHTQEVLRPIRTRAGSEANGYSEAASLSPDGRFIAYQTSAPLIPGDNEGNTDVYLSRVVAPGP